MNGPHEGGEPLVGEGDHYAGVGQLLWVVPVLASSVRDTHRMVTAASRGLLVFEAVRSISSAPRHNV